MHLVGASPATLVVNLVPGFGVQNVVHILDLVVAPYRGVDILPAHRLEGVVYIRESDPAIAPELGDNLLVGKVHVVAIALNLFDDLLVQGGRGPEDGETTVHHGDGAAAGVGTLALGEVRVSGLRGKGAVVADPCGRVVGFLERVAGADVGGGKDALGCRGGASRAEGRVVEGQVHELVHVAEDEHVGVELDYAVVLGEGKGGELGKCLEEARVGGEVEGGTGGGREVVDMLDGDVAGGEGGEAGRGEAVGVEGEKGVGGFDVEEGLVEGEEAREVVEVGDEGCPDCGRILVGEAGKTRGRGNEGRRTFGRVGSSFAWRRWLCHGVNGNGGV